MLLGFIGICSGAWAADTFTVSDNAVGLATCGETAAASINRTFPRIYNGIHEYHISINTPTYKNEALKGGPHNGNGDGEASITVTASVTYKVEEIADGAVEVTIINRSIKKTPETKMCKDYTH